MENEMHDDFFIPQLSAQTIRKTFSQKRIKRTFDFVFSLFLALLIFPWLFPLVALLIILDSDGGVLFIQKRNGLNNEVFNCIKFRTMFINQQADTDAAEDNDLRITKIGKWLRLYGIDELPQLFNVLSGDMSLVGPRPHMHSDNLKFEQIVSHYQDRHQIRPGITGLAQVKGYKGKFTDDQQIKRRIALDLVYVDTYCFTLDCRIIVATIKMMLVQLFKENLEKNGRDRLYQIQ